MTVLENMYTDALETMSSGDTARPPIDVPLDETIEVVTGVDGNDISLFIARPSGVSEPLPCVYHMHGGGMAMLDTSSGIYHYWRQSLAARGMVVVSVQFRNASGALGQHPYPAGLNDCLSGLAWTHANRDSLNITKIILQGDSGGGNLSIAVVLRAKSEGTLDMIQGVFSMCPYIAGPNAYFSPPPELSSLVEFEGYFLSLRTGALPRIYNPDGSADDDKFAWPRNATVEDLTGLPPHCISVNELDPLRDEGIEHYRKLLRAGVRAWCRTVNGTCHAGDEFPGAIPEVFASTQAAIKCFAESV